jgi:hypothetical protein
LVDSWRSSWLLGGQLKDLEAAGIEEAGLEEISMSIIVNIVRSILELRKKQNKKITQTNKNKINDIRHENG